MSSNAHVNLGRSQRQGTGMQANKDEDEKKRTSDREADCHKEAISGKQQSEVRWTRLVSIAH